MATHFMALVFQPLGERQAGVEIHGDGALVSRTLIPVENVLPRQVSATVALTARRHAELLGV